MQYIHLGSLFLHNPRNSITLSLKSQHKESWLNHSFLRTMFQVLELRPRPHVSMSNHILYPITFKIISYHLDEIAQNIL